MNSQTPRQDGAGRGTSAAQGASGTDQADGQSADETARGDHDAITQAARSVMHPERHDPEWRYYHGAARG
jgi:hypothetical protein